MMKTYTELQEHVYKYLVKYFKVKPVYLDGAMVLHDHLNSNGLAELVLEIDTFLGYPIVDYLDYGNTDQTLRTFLNTIYADYIK